MKDEKGAASVLVICMMLVLVTLGTLAIASANANNRLSQRSLAWNTMYYTLDAQGEIFLSLLDGKLAAAEKATTEYLQTRLAEGYQEDDAIAGNLFLLNAEEYINELSLNYPKMTLDNSESTVNLIFTHEEDSLFRLAVSVAVRTPVFTVSETDGIISAVWEDGQSRYKIEEWYVYQEDTPQEQDIQIWDGEL